MKIFVSIVSYRDPLLASTLDSLIENKSQRHEAVYGIFEQTVFENSLEKTRPDLIERSDVRYKRIDPIFSEGVGWAREFNQWQITDEQFFYQIDSHMLFDPNWDRTLIEDYKNGCEITGCKKVLITAPCKSYDLEDGVPKPHVYHEDMTGMMRYFTISDNNVAGAHGEFMRSVESVFPAFHICAGNMFTCTDWISDVGNKKDVFFDGEEQLLSLRTFEAGYKMFHPTKICSYHFSGTNAYVTKQWHEPIITHEKYSAFVSKSVKQLNDYLEQVRESVLVKYHEYSGIDYVSRTIDDRSYTDKIKMAEKGPVEGE